MNKMTFGCKLASVLFLLSFVIYGLNITYLSLQTISQLWQVNIWWGTYLLIILSLFLFLNFIAAYGLFNQKRWGFTFAYLAIIFSTLFFSYPYLPFIGKIINSTFSINHRYLTLIMLNFAVLAYIGYLHFLYSKIKR